MSRPRHRHGKYEELFKRAEAKGWRIDGGGSVHFQMFCPCKDKHLVTVSTTPKNPTWVLRLVIKDLRKTCWREAT